MFETSERQRSITVGKIPSSHQNTVEHRFNESIYQYKEFLGISKVFLAPKNLDITKPRRANIFCQCHGHSPYIEGMSEQEMNVLTF